MGSFDFGSRSCWCRLVISCLWSFSSSEIQNLNMSQFLVSAQFEATGCNSNILKLYGMEWSRLGPKLNADIFFPAVCGPKHGAYIARYSYYYMDADRKLMNQAFCHCDARAMTLLPAADRIPIDPRCDCNGSAKLSA